MEKHVLAAYLNMARNNLFIVLSDLKEITGIKSAHSLENNILIETSASENNMHKWDILNKYDEMPADVRQMIKQYLQKHLPFIKNWEDNCIVNFKNFIQLLNSLRNYYDHYEAIRKHDYDSSNAGMLNSLFDAARINIKIKEGIAFPHNSPLIRKVRNGDNRNFKFSFLNNTGILNDVGIVYFICLFLEKKYAYQLLSKSNEIREIIRKNNIESTIVYSIFTAYTIKLPKPKIETSANNNVMLALDILEELKRCPKECYDQISSENQKKFKQQEKNELSAISGEIIFKRYKNRFPYLALKYLEITGAVPKLKFQTDLGNFFFEVYNKNVAGANRIRKLSKRLKGFGYTNDFAIENMTDEWRALISQFPRDEKYITNTNPHYHFVNNQIGIKVLNEPIKPQLTPTYNQKPDMWLSVHELPALLFYHIITLNKKSPKTINLILNNHSRKVKEFFNDIAQGTVERSSSKEAFLRQVKDKYKLLEDEIPETFINYYTLSTDKENKLKDYCIGKIQAELNHTSDLLTKLDRDIENSKQKRSSKKYRPLQKGRYAMFLAKDFLSFQPTDQNGKGKVNNLLFNVLQSRLAIFNEKKETLTQLLSECRLIDSDNPHPFLKEGNNLLFNKNLIEYYRNYLVRRKRFLEKCNKEIKEGGNVKGNSNYYFLHLSDRILKNGEDDYIKMLARKFEDEPINLPRGLFKKYIIEVIKQEAEVKPLHEFIPKDNENADKVSIDYLALQYLEKIQNDAPQEFYNYKRNYNVFDEKFYDLAGLKKQRANFKRKIEDKTNYTTEELKKLRRGFRFHDENEKMLRHTKSCDVILFLLAKKLLSESGIPADEIKLNPVIGNNTSFLDQTIELCFKKSNKTIKAELSLKDYGKIKALLKDARLNGLLNYFPENKVISIEKIKDDFEKYDQLRINAHEIILSFEQSVCQRNKLKLRGDYIDFNTILQFYVNKNPLGVNQDKMRKIRNAFAHNNYPNSTDFNDIIPNDNSTIAEQLFGKIRLLFPHLG